MYGYTVASISISLCKLGKYYNYSVLDDDVFFSSRLWHTLYPFTKFVTKFTDQQSHTCALLILMHTAIQVVYINTFCGMFCGVLNFDTYMVEARR